MGYDGFISYSHAADDRLAPALQRGLQRLAKKWNSRRALRIFRDETGLSTNPDLWSAIETALDESDWFVLLASPDSASSEWVNKEVAHWVATKPLDHILPVVTDGTWEWDASSRDFTADSTSVPPALRGVLRDEARHLDLRWARDETDLDLRNSRFRAAVADLAAPMHGIAKDDLEGEDIRQHRRARRLARAAVCALVVLVVVALVSTGLAVDKQGQANRNAKRATTNADEAQARGLASEAETLLQSNRLDEALIIAVEAQQIAQRTPRDGPAAARARIALLRALTAGPTITGFLPGLQDPPATIRYSPDGKTIVSASNRGEVQVWDAATRHLMPHQPPRQPAGVAAAAMNDHGLLAITSGAVEELWDLKTNRSWHWQPPRRHDAADLISGSHFAQLALSDSGRLAVAASDGVTSRLDVWDVNTGRRIGTPLRIGGSSYPDGGHVESLTFSPDGSQLAVSSVPAADIGSSGTNLSVQLVDVSTAKAGLLLGAHYGTFSYYLAPFVDALVFSPDGRRISSVASRGPATVPFRQPTTAGAIATFDTRTGARIANNSVGAGMELMGVSPDLHELAVRSADGNAMSVLDARTGARLASLPIPGLDPTAPVAFNPTRPNVVFQSGAGAPTVADWTQYGARPFVTTAAERHLPSATVASATGTPIDLTPALRELGLPAGCFVPLFSSCDYTTDVTNLDNYFQHRAKLIADDPRHTWSATASAAGPVAIVGGGAIAIWNPNTHRIERRLNGVPKTCLNFLPRDLAFVGTAGHGRIVLACSPNLLSWDLASPTPTPGWTQPWLGIDPGSSTNAGVVLSADGRRGAVVGQGVAARLFAPSTGRAGPTGPTTTWDPLTAIAFAPDDNLGQLHVSGALDLVRSDGTTRRTLVSRTGNVGDLGSPLRFQGPAAGRTPQIAFGPDNTAVAVAHDSIGVELWDRQTGESLALLGGFLTRPEQNIEPTPQNGELDFRAMHRLSLAFDNGGDALRESDVRELVHFVNGMPTHEYSSLLRTITWSLRPADWTRAACAVAGRDLTHQEWNDLIGSTAPYHQTCTPLLDKPTR